VGRSSSQIPINFAKGLTAVTFFFSHNVPLTLCVLNAQGMETLSGSLTDKKKQEFIWARFVESLEADFLLSEDEKKQMLIGDFSFVPANTEAQRFDPCLH